MGDINIKGILYRDVSKGKRVEQVLKLAWKNGADDSTQVVASENPWDSLGEFLQHAGMDAVVSKDGKRGICMAEAFGMDYRISIWYDKKEQEITYIIVPFGIHGQGSGSIPKDKEDDIGHNICWVRFDIR